MAVQPQTPYKEYTANGSTKSFALEFDCDNQDHLIVLVDDVEAIVGTWSLSNGAVVFGNAPATGKKITVQRNTPFRRDGDFQSYDNSFRPGPVNKGFDWVWLKLQELGVADWILSNRIDALQSYVNQQDGILQENIDSLKNYVDDKDDELRNYLLNAIQEQGVALDQLEEYYSYLIQQLAQVAIDRGWAASFIVSADGSTQQEINDRIGNTWYAKPLGYELNARVMLTNGDIVKNTIDGNTNDPNVDMTGWIKTNSASQIFDESGLSQQEINDTVKSEMPFSTHAYTTLQAANDSTSGNILHLEKKPYTNSVDLDKNSIQGSGYETVLNVETGNYAIKVKQSLPNWDKLRISDLTIGGLTRVNTTGVLFDPADAVAGRRNLEYISLNNLDIAIHKPTGNIGNTYSNVNAYDCNYVIKANSVWTPQEMHSGNDTWRDFQVDHIDKWAFDYTDLTGGGAIHIKDGIIEYCNGGGIRLEYSDRYPPFIPPRISNVWFEQIAKAPTIVRDGVTEVPRAIKLVNTDMCIIENCKLDNIELVNSSALALNCRVDSTNMVIDVNSNLIVENAFLNGSVPNNVTVSSIATQSYPAHFGANLTLRGSDIVSVEQTPVSASAAVGITYTGNVGKLWAVDGSALIYAESVIDTNGTQCARLNLTASTVNVLPYITTPSDHWVVWGISAKQVGALSGSFKFNMDYNLGDIILEDGKWVNSFGIAKSPAADMNIRANLSPTTNGTILIKDYFIASFKKESDAVAFVNSRTAINTYPEVVYKNYSPPIIPANGSVQTNIDFLGVSLVDNIVSSFNKPLSGVEVTSYVTSQNVVTVVFRNPTSKGITLPSGTISSKLV